MKPETSPSNPTPDTGTKALAPVDAAKRSPVWSAADLARASIAKNTRRAYEWALQEFEQSPYPETDAGVAAFLMRLYQQGRSAAAVLWWWRRCVSGPSCMRGRLQWVQRQLGCWPGSDDLPQTEDGAW